MECEFEQHVGIGQQRSRAVKDDFLGLLGQGSQHVSLRAKFPNKELVRDGPTYTDQWASVHRVSWDLLTFEDARVRWNVRTVMTTSGFVTRHGCECSIAAGRITRVASNIIATRFSFPKEESR